MNSVRPFILKILLTRIVTYQKVNLDSQLAVLYGHGPFSLSAIESPRVLVFWSRSSSFGLVSHYNIHLRKIRYTLKQWPTKHAPAFVIEIMLQSGKCHSTSGSFSTSVFLAYIPWTFLWFSICVPGIHTRF